MWGTHFFEAWTLDRWGWALARMVGAIALFWFVLFRPEQYARFEAWMERQYHRIFRRRR